MRAKAALIVIATFVGASPTFGLGIAHTASHPATYGPSRLDPLRPDNQPGFHALFGITALTPSNATAVGEGGSQVVAKARQWDGTHWLPSTPPGGRLSELFATTSITTHETWAVGDAGDSALAERWNGTTWTRTTTPPPAPQTYDVLDGVDGTSPEDIWAVGYTQPDTGGPIPLIEHWNGHTWTKVDYTLPYGNTEGHLTSITTLSPTNAWAVGYTLPRAAPLVEHWNGLRWRPITTLAGPFNSSIQNLTSVTAVSSRDIWAVGSAEGGRQTVAVHWDGHHWAVVPTPNGPQELNSLLAVTAITDDDIWAVGTSGPYGAIVGQTLTLHWDGHQWTTVPAPNPGHTNNGLWAVAATNSHDVWAVGYLSDNGETTTTNLCLHWNGQRWTRQRA